MAADKKAEKAFADLGRAISAKSAAAIAKAVTKVDPDLQPYNMLGDSLLRFAVNNGGSLATIKLLVEHGAKLSYKNRKGETPIDAALEHERTDVIEYFASKGAKIKHVPFEKLSAKDKAERLAKILNDWYDDKCAKRLAAALDGGADPNAKVGGVTAMQRIAGHGDLEPLFKLLLAAGGDPKAVDKRGDTPVHLIARHGYAKAMALFLDAGVPIDLRDGKGNTPLHRAAGDGYNGADKVVKLLLDRGADPMLENKAGKTAVDVATEELKKLLLKRVGTPLSTKGKALLAAVAANDAKKVAKALANGANPSEVDAMSGTRWGDSGLDGVAALHVALARGVDRAIVDQLLASKPDVNVKAVDGRTPLHVVLQFGRGADRAELVDRLLALGADVNAKNGRGETPIYEATSFYQLDGELELIDALVAAGANKKVTDNHGETVLDQMVERTQRFHEVNDKPGFVAMIAKLIDAGFKTKEQKTLDAWMKAKGAKYAPAGATKASARKSAKPARSAKSAKPHPRRAVFDKITGGTLHSYVDAKTTLELAGKQRPVALFDWFVYAADHSDDKNDCMMQIAEYHIAGDAMEEVGEARWIPFGVVGMNGALDSYREVGVDGTLYLDVSNAKGNDAPVVFATQSYMGLSPAKPLAVGKLRYAALMKTLKK